MATMLMLFEVHLAPGHHAGELLSDEVLASTRAQIMTPAEAKAVGFAGLPDMASNVRFIAVNGKDANWIHRNLEGSHAVAGFKVHEVD
jgi:hypothetical protein